MTYIGIGRRFVAWFVDLLITSLAWVPFADVTSSDGTTSIRWEGMDFVLPLLITLAYFIVLEGLAGATVGKLVLGIRVRRIDGSHVGFGPAAIRNVSRVVDAFPYVIPYLVGGIAVIRSETKQRLGDRWAKTVVILVGTDSKAATQEHEMAATGSDPFGLPSPPHNAPGLDRRDGTLPPPPPAP